MQIVLRFRVFIAAGAFIGLHSCSATEPKAVVPEYHYYPETNVYYDKTNNQFIYSLDSARTWLTYTPSSEREPGTMGKHVVIPSANPEVWKENEEHRRVHNGAIMAMPNTQISYAAAKAVAERKSTKPAVYKRKEAEDDKKSKKGIKGLFDKIFKKKKD